MPYERLVNGYLAHANAVAHDLPDSHFWAYEGLHGLVDKSPEAAWPAVVEVVERCRDNRVLGYVSADILEDLICAHALDLIDRIEERARADAHFRGALAGVRGWSRMPAEARSRLDDLVGHTSGRPDR